MPKKAKLWFEGEKEPVRQVQRPAPLKINVRIQSGIPINVSDEGDSLVARAELPGFSKEDIRVKVSDRMLEVVVRKVKREITQGTGSYREESSSGEVRRTLSLPVEIDTKRTRSSFKDGVLEIVMPKAR